MNVKNQNGNITIHFGMPGRRIKVYKPILTLKLVAMARFIERTEKGISSVSYGQISTIWWKLGEN